MQRRDHANFALNSREKIAKSPKNFGAPRAQNLREHSQRGCANRRTSLQLFSESACVRMQDNARVQRRDDANFAQKSREKFAKIIAEKNGILKKTKKRLKRKKRWVADRFFLLDVIVSFVQKKNNHPQQKKTISDSSCDRFFCPAPSHAIPPRGPRVSRAHHVEVAGHRAPIQPKTSLPKFVI